jgi:hypothetical protein
VNFGELFLCFKEYKNIAGNNHLTVGNVHCRVPEKEWSFQDGGRASLFKVGLVV